MGSDYCCRCGKNLPPPPPPGVPCHYCSTGYQSKCLRIKFRGISNPPFHEPGACADCHCHNGRTYRIAASGFAGGDPPGCWWYGSISNSCTCATTTVYAGITRRETEPGSGVTHYYLHAKTYWGPGVGKATYELDLGEDKPNCEALYNRVLPVIDYTDGKCQFAGSSLVVSSSIFDCDHLPRMPRGSAVCAECGSTYPHTIFVRLSGLTTARHYCFFQCSESQCAAMAGTYALRPRLSLPCWGDPSGPDSCVWGYDFPSHYCAWAGLTAQICTTGSGAGKAHRVIVNLRTDWAYGPILTAELGRGHPSCAGFYAAGIIEGYGCCISDWGARSHVEAWW
jgi:hypothetical protein